MLTYPNIIATMINNINSCVFWFITFLTWWIKYNNAISIFNIKCKLWLRIWSTCIYLTYSLTNLKFFYHYICVCVYQYFIAKFVPLNLNIVIFTLPQVYTIAWVHETSHHFDNYRPWIDKCWKFLKAIMQMERCLSSFISLTIFVYPILIMYKELSLSLCSSMASYFFLLSLMIILLWKYKKPWDITVSTEDWGRLREILFLIMWREESCQYIRYIRYISADS